MRAVRNKHLVIAGTTVAAIAAITVPISMAMADTRDEAADPANAACEIEALGDEDGGVRYVSDSGEYLAGFHKSGTGALPVVWHDGEPTILDQDFQIHDINSSGVVVGYKYNAETETDEAWMWQDGEFTQLTAPNPKGGVQAVAINDDGVIAGNTGLTHLDDEVYADVPLRWQSGETEAEELTVESGLLGTAIDIAADGTVLGGQTADHQADPLRPWSWSPDDTGTELTAPDGSRVGTIKTVRGEWALSRAYRWNLSKPGEPIENAMNEPMDVDEQGRVYGAEWDADDVAYPAMEVDGEVTLLPMLDDEHQEGDADTISGVNADGTLLAGTSAKGDAQLPVIWRCG